MTFGVPFAENQNSSSAFQKTYNSFSGADMQLTFGGEVIGEADPEVRGVRLPGGTGEEVRPGGGPVEDGDVGGRGSLERRQREGRKHKKQRDYHHSAAQTREGPFRPGCSKSKS